MPGWVEVLLKTFVVIVLFFAITKLVGKKKVGDLGLFEFLTSITIAGLSAFIIIADRPFIHGIISILLIGLVLFLIDLFALKSKKFHDFTKGNGTVLIKDGKILEDNLKKEKLTTDELLSSLRQKNIFKYADVEFAILEATGDVSVFPKKEMLPLTPKLLNIKVAEEKEPYTVIQDGKIVEDSLGKSGKNRQWLQTELDKLGVLLENIYVGQVDSYGELTIDLYDDTITVPSPQQRPLLLAMLKKCAADLEGFALATDNKEAKEMFEKNKNKLNNAIKKVESYLK
ncbi:hypothetical protein BC6307_11500 [Sutcliffiella cohnii]|uniref:YetF C-terminal domain-containing protein n=1 Tax=Sutcliffiella cohnii TaxID=33932 RepID=A0A223KR44_9BACI|nr:DUF421 domain-containing protein [Sutcliffiella cohnii]AST91857.1 hypothetical protein BC6307_11500 [Sutcliffiella cohnii]